MAKMTAKTFFKKVEDQLKEHLRTRPDLVKDIDSIHIGDFDQVLTILASLIQRDSRVQEDLNEANRQMAALAEEFGLDIDRIEEEKDGDEDPDTGGTLLS